MLESHKNVSWTIDLHEKKVYSMTEKKPWKLKARDVLRRDWGAPGPQDGQELPGQEEGEVGLQPRHCHGLQWSPAAGPQEWHVLVQMCPLHGVYISVIIVWHFSEHYSSQVKTLSFPAGTSLWLLKFIVVREAVQKKMAKTLEIVRTSNSQAFLMHCFF